MTKKILYLECYSGISGDMTVGALLDLGADPDVLRRSLDSLDMDGYEIKIGRAVKCGIDACDFDVQIPGQPDYDEGHGHMHEHGHEHEHVHEAEHGHEHGNTHVHRHLSDIYEIIERLDNEHVRELSKKIFRIVAEAESKAHGVPPEEVHFHEIGAIDSIVDIISTAVCIDDLGIDDVAVSEMYEGTGHVHCQHGLMPVPVPATVNIAAMYDLPLRITDTEGEMVTPTGAAIAAALRTMDSLPKDYRIVKIGLGAGKKDFPKANILRAMILETKEDAHTEENEEIWKLESNIDDCSGEVLGYTMEKIMAAGARDVYYTPVYMKKGRPAYMLSVLCDSSMISEVEDIIFAETTTIGIRRFRVERTVLDRSAGSVKTPYGDVAVKICSRNGQTFSYPEYDSVKSVCEAGGVPFKTVYQAACRAEEECSDD